jgi:hypothetical protein
MKEKEIPNSYSNVLVGNNFFAIYYQTKIDKIRQLNYSPHWALKPYGDSAVTLDPSGFPRIQTEVSIMNNEDVVEELKHNYSIKSIMSTDGIFSPISFYPTPNSATYHISKYPTPCCPFCNGTRTYNYTVLRDNASVDTGGINSIDGAIETRNSAPLLCPFCESSTEKEKRVLKSAKPRESYPPFIVASGNDLEIISTLNTSGASGMPIINYGTLNPFILSNGEFGNFQNKQSGDLTGFSIDLVAHGMMPPTKGDSLSPLYSNSIFNAYSDRDRSFDLWYADMVSKGIALPPLPASGRKNNIRSFGLRGPVMLHSWGYDIEGFPVPNSSGEPLIQNGTIVYQSGHVVGKNQKIVIGPNGQTMWSKPYKENTFYKGWGQMPSTWPVGPIDFRWDSEAGVWTVGSNYKPVFVALEEDLVNRQPVRGSIIDSSQSSMPLPNGLRKLVFVRDPIGTFSAPRGAAVYCRYDSNNGFYEPIARSAYITSGTIRSQNTAEIYKVYSPIPDYFNIDLSQPPVVETYEVLFSDPINFKASPGSIGLFSFIGSGWVLQTYNCS